VQGAYEGRFFGHGASASLTGEVGRRLIDTLRRRRVRRVIAVFVKRARGARVKVRAKSPMASPGRLKPKGASSGRRTNPSSNRQELLEGSRPRNCGLSGPACRFGGGSTGRAKR